MYKFLVLLIGLFSALQGVHLSEFPAPFIELESKKPINFELVLPTNPSTSEVEAAMRLSAFISKMMPFEAFDVPVKTGTVPADKHQIVILDKGTQMGAGTGFLSLQINDQGLWRLLIEGNNAEGLDKALSVLENEEILRHLQIDTLAIHQFPPKEADDDYKLFFNQLGKDPHVFKGSNSSKEIHVFPPLREKLNQESYITLNFKHSRLLDAHKSLLKVYINEVLASQAQLSESNAEKGILTFKIPASEFYKKEWLIKFVVNQELEEGVDSASQAWTLIENSSFIHFLENDVASIAPTLDNFPGILTAGQASTDQIILTLPDDLTEPTLTAALQIAALGAKNNLYPIKWKVVKGQDLSKADQSAPFMILLGTDRDVMEWKILGLKFPSIKNWQAALIPLNSPWKKGHIIYAIVMREEIDCPIFLKKLFTSNSLLTTRDEMAVMDKDFKVETKPIKLNSKNSKKNKQSNQSLFYLIGVGIILALGLIYYLRRQK